MYKLKRGDKVAIVAPCGQIGNLEKIRYGLQYIQSLGFIPIYGKNLLSRYRYMAGNDKQRAEDINTAFADTDIKAVFCARAAAGGSRILPYLDFELIRRNHKPFIGFCDNAALQLALWQKSQLVSYNGMVMTYDFQSENLDSQIKEDLEKLLNGQIFNIKSGKPLQKGHTSGTLLCSNLSVLTKLCGTPYFPDLKNTILLLEDVHERIHKIDLMLQQLKQQPNFTQVKGIIFGQFTDCSGDEEDGNLFDCFRDFLQDTNIPAIYDFNFGHTPSRRVLPTGAQVDINAEKTELNILGY